MPGLVILGAVELLHLQLPHHPGDWPVLWRCQYQRCSLHSEWYSQILSDVDDFLLLEAGQPTDYDQGDMNIFYFVRIRTINSIELLCWNYRKIAKIFFFTSRFNCWQFSTIKNVTWCWILNCWGFFLQYLLGLDPWHTSTMLNIASKQLLFHDHLWWYSVASNNSLIDSSSLIDIDLLSCRKISWKNNKRIKKQLFCWYNYYQPNIMLLMAPSNTTTPGFSEAGLVLCRHESSVQQGDIVEINNCWLS